MAFLKHNGGSGKGKPRVKKPESNGSVNVVVSGPGVETHGIAPSMQHDINHVAGLSGVEESLDWIARALDRLTGGLTNGEHDFSLTSTAGPVKLTLVVSDEDDTMDRFITALERIADSVAKLAGLTRPRLESWHEQDEYNPRFKDVACDGGAPGPKDGPDN
jgi:hypothetical protein